MVSELQWKKALLFRDANSPVSWDTQQGSELNARRPNATNKLLDFETLRNPNLYQENKPESDLRVCIRSLMPPHFQGAYSFARSFI